MLAVQYDHTGGPEVLHVAEAADPHAGPGQIRVAVRASGVNPMDWKRRQGMFPIKLPRIPGLEVAGVVDEVGDGVTGVSAGNEVFGPAVTGSAAQYALVKNFAKKPAAMSFEEAAGVSVAAETSVRVFDALGVQPGHTLLINAASGGVGFAAVQLAVARGITVIGTASEPNHDFLRELGATPTTYGVGLGARVAAIAPEGVDYAFDAGGRGALPELVEITGGAERVITIVDYQGAQETGVRFSGGMGGEPRAWHALAEAARLYEAGGFVVPVAQSFSFDDAAQAHRISESGHVRGKLVIVAG